jgi:hypothetical protein
MEPKQIDYTPNSITRHHDWAMLKKDYIKYFTEHFEFFADIIVNEAHHVFPAPTSMSREDDQRVEDILPNELIREASWLLAKPLVERSFLFYLNHLETSLNCEILTILQFNPFLFLPRFLREPESTSEAISF